MGQAVNPTVGVERSFGTKRQIRIGIQAGVPIPQSEKGDADFGYGHPSRVSALSANPSVGGNAAGSSKYLRGDARATVTAAIPIMKRVNFLGSVFGGIDYAWNSKGIKCGGIMGCAVPTSVSDAAEAAYARAEAQRPGGTSGLFGGLVGIEAELPKDYSFAMGVGITVSGASALPEMGMRLSKHF